MAIFNFNNSELRVVELEGKPWFVAKDVCDVLGISERARGYADSNLGDEESTLYQIQKGLRSQRVLTESGLYKLILPRDTPQAHPIQA